MFSVLSIFFEFRNYAYRPRDDHKIEEHYESILPMLCWLVSTREYNLIPNAPSHEWSIVISSIDKQ